MDDIRMHSPHDVDTYAGQSKLSSDAKESDSAHYFGLLSVGPRLVQLLYRLWYCGHSRTIADPELEPEPVMLLLPATAT